MFLGVGLLLLIGGFVYDLTFAGIPYQDPTPEMSARYAYHSRVAGMIYRLALVTFVIGGLGYTVRLAGLFARPSRKNESLNAQREVRK